MFTTSTSMPRHAKQISYVPSISMASTGFAVPDKIRFVASSKDSGRFAERIKSLPVPAGMRARRVTNGLPCFSSSRLARIMPFTISCIVPSPPTDTIVFAPDKVRLYAISVACFLRAV